MPKKVSAKKAQSFKPASRTPAKTVKKTAPHAKPVKKAVLSVASPKKSEGPKTVSRDSVPPPKTVQKPAPKPGPSAESKKPRFLKGALDRFKSELLLMRDRITGQSGSMRHAALQRNDETNHEEDGTDAFMRLQTLEQVSSQQQVIANIDEALRSIEKGNYGICSMCGELINKPRLAVLPFAKHCIACQSEMERPIRSVGRR
ncbi:MAG: TraR/DksA C4-type zinc finger protein [bacterium]